MTSEKKVSLNGLILGGGKSTRMGYDKGTIAYHGAPQRDHLFSMLKRHCADVYYSVKDDHEIPPHLNPLKDRFDMDSPLNGILTAFEHNPEISWLTVPVDMPGVDDAVIKHLIQARDPDSLATCFYDSSGKKPEPLVAIWEPACLSDLRIFFQEGKLSPREFLMRFKTKIIPAPAALFHSNINTPGELHDFKKNKPHH